MGKQNSWTNLEDAIEAKFGKMCASMIMGTAFEGTREFSLPGCGERTQSARCQGLGNVVAETVGHVTYADSVFGEFTGNFEGREVSVKCRAYAYSSDVRLRIEMPGDSLVVQCSQESGWRIPPI